MELFSEAVAESANRRQPTTRGWQQMREREGEDKQTLLQFPAHVISKAMIDVKIGE